MTQPNKYGYEEDFYAWTNHNAKLLKEGKFNEVDIQNIIEEIESMGRSERNSLVNRLAILIAHLLKWRYQPGLQGHSWKYTIAEQRIKVIESLENSPSLGYEIEKKLIKSYKQARVRALKETGLEESTFPRECPFTIQECLDENFYPGK
jgi:hypothetical protein